MRLEKLRYFREIEKSRLHNEYKDPLTALELLRL